MNYLEKILPLAFPSRWLPAKKGESHVLKEQRINVLKGRGVRVIPSVVYDFEQAVSFISALLEQLPRDATLRDPSEKCLCAVEGFPDGVGYYSHYIVFISSEWDAIETGGAYPPFELK